MTFTVSPVRFEHHREALGIGEAAPRLSWKIQTDTPGWTQRAYQLRIHPADGATDAATEGAVSNETDDAVTNETDEIVSYDTVLVAWPFAPMGSRARRSVSVRVWGNGEAEPSAWSEPAVVETGLLEPSDWTAALIAPVAPDESETDRAPVLFRREFEVGRQPSAARLYVTAHGVFEAEINGVTVGSDVLAPGWSSYRHRLRYFTYDVTSLLQDGGNAIGATVADGWFRGLIGFEGGRRNIYGDRTALLAQLEITYSDGTVETIDTDDSWRVGTGPILTSGIYEGEVHDARREPAGWSSAGFDDAGWEGVSAISAPTEVLVAPPGPPVRRIQEVPPVAITRSPSGATLVDFGQNLVGRLRITVSGPAGHTVTLRHAEVLEHGELGTRPLRVATATDRYTLRGSEGGGAPEIWEPRFTFHGFRYAEVTGWPGDLDPADLVAVVLHTDMERTGWFDCSDALLNRLHENVVWGMRGNFLDLPTDCPQRDERLGWTGDIQVFTPTARFLYDCTGMLSSWLADVAAEQQELGTVPVYVPYVKFGFFSAAPVAAWGDAAVVVPWALYQRDGDLGLLRRQYPSMRAWVDEVAAIAGTSHLWNTGMQLGDWLDPTAPPDKPADAQTDAHLVSAAYHALTARLLAEAAEILGESADAATYTALAAATRDAFRREFVSANGRMASDAPTAFAIGLQFGLLDDEQRGVAGNRLVQLVKKGNHHIATGFVGTPLICDALSGVGAHDTAYHLLTQQECPSWLYSVTMGATTIWERWDSMLPDGTINPGDMTSFNHYALGAVADWMHRTVAGLAPAAPGYRRISIAPRPGGGLTSAVATHETPYGRAEVSWQRIGDLLTVTAQVPAGTTAVVQLPEPGWAPQQVESGVHTFECRFRPAAEDPPRPIYNPFAELAG